VPLLAESQGGKMSIALIGVELLAHYRKQISEYIEKIGYRLKHGNEKIIVLGAGGVGKTTLGKVLAGQDPIAGEKYQESANTEVFSYEGKIYGTVLVAPGQERRRAFTWPELRTQISQGQVLGIVFVVAGGLNSLREIEPEEHELYKQGMTNEEFLKEYRAYNVRNETKILQEELLSCLRDCPNRIFFLTVILKEDLWRPEHRAVMNLYSKGGFAEVIAELVSKRGENHFAYDIVSASLLIENLTTKKGAVLANTASGFDTNEQTRSVTNLLRIISEFMQDKKSIGSH
jgi:GTPase SAR1 family protein